METDASEYDPRYLEGIRLFNAGEFFEAHEVWEELWMDCQAEDRRFYQSLIHAAVAVYHASRRNWRGTARLLISGSRYAALYPCPYRGLDHSKFWQKLRDCLTPVSDGKFQSIDSIPTLGLSEAASDSRHHG